MDYAINSMTGRRGLIDSIELEVSFQGLRFSDAVVLGLELEWVLSLAPAGGAGSRSPQPSQRRLPIRVLRQGNHSVLHARGAFAATCVADLHPGVLDRVEAFRAGGLMHQRLEGRVTYLQHGVDERGQALVLRQLVDQSNTQDSLSGPSRPVVREEWAAVLDELRGERRVVLELSFHRDDLPDDLAESFVRQLNKAQQAFDDGNYTEVARLAFILEEFLKKSPHAAQRRYGDAMYKALTVARQGIARVANHERHHDETGLDVVDRRIALFLLVSLKALAHAWF